MIWYPSKYIFKYRLSKCYKTGYFEPQQTNAEFCTVTGLENVCRLTVQSLRSLDIRLDWGRHLFPWPAEPNERQK